MSSNDAWVMVGGIRGTPDAAAADLLQRMALAAVPDMDMVTPIEELCDLAGVPDVSALLKTLEVVSHTTVSLMAAPEGWLCSGGSLISWSVSGAHVRWRVSGHVHAAFTTDDAPSLATLLPFVGKPAKGARAMRLFDIFHRAASRERPFEIDIEDALRLLDASGMRSDFSRHVIEPAVTEVAICAPFLTSIEVGLGRGRERGRPIRTVSCRAAFRHAPLSAAGFIRAER